MRIGVHQPLAAGFFVLLMQAPMGGGFSPLHAETAHARASSGCAAVKAGALTIELDAGQSTTREFSLAAGEFLNISTQGSAGNSAAVSLFSGAGSPLKVLSGDEAGVGGFTARDDGNYGFLVRAGEHGSARVTATCSALSEPATLDQSFLQRRHDLIASREPDRIRIEGKPTLQATGQMPLPQHIDVDEDGRPKRLAFSVSWSELAAAAEPLRKANKSGVFDFWLEGRYENYGSEPGANAGNIGVVYLGNKYMVSPNIMIGTLTQFDQAGEVDLSTGTRVSASGWMMGPFVSMRLAPGLVFDGRAGWGQSINAVNQTDDKDERTARQLVRGRLTSTREVSGWRVAPSIGVSYLRDALPDTVSTGRGAPAKGVGRVEVLPEISRRFAIDGSTYVEPRAAVGAVWGFNDLGQIASPSFVTSPDLHMRAEAGVSVGSKDGTTLQAMGSMETTGQSSSDNWTGRLQLNMPLGN